MAISLPELALLVVSYNCLSRNRINPPMPYGIFFAPFAANLGYERVDNNAVHRHRIHPMTTLAR
jgi:hypothetical protein